MLASGNMDGDETVLSDKTKTQYETDSSVALEKIYKYMPTK